MKRSAVFILLFLLTGHFFSALGSSEASAMPIASTAPIKVRSKTGLYFSFNHRYDNSQMLDGGQSYMNYLTNTQSYTFGVYRNHRLFKGFYYQPEVSYQIFNGNDEQRVALVSFVPLQAQIGLHLGWGRPFLSGGAFLNMTLMARDAQGKSIDMNGWDGRSAWGYFYGAGLDVLSFFQVHVRVKQWMLNFHELSPRNFGEVSAGVSFFF